MDRTSSPPEAKLSLFCSVFFFNLNNGPSVAPTWRRYVLLYSHLFLQLRGKLEQREDMGLLEYQVMLALHDVAHGGLLCILTTVKAAVYSGSSQLGSSCQGN
jgi:hypothetical protein